MTSIPALPQSADYSYRHQHQETLALSATSKNASGEQRMQVSAYSASSSSTTVTISGRQPSHTYAVAEVEKPQPAPNAKASDNILGFIALRLERDDADGASSEELASRIQAAYDGFIEGYNDAFEELSAAGLLSPEVETAISQTYDAVLSGIDELAEQYGVASPVQSQPKIEVDDSAEVIFNQLNSAGQVFNAEPFKTPQSTFADFAQDLVNPGRNLSVLLESSTFDYESLAKRDFSFDLKTQDGDTVTITASATQSERAEASSVRYEGPYREYNAARVGVERSQSSSFNIQVDGDLDESELAAINDLLSQVGELSESFYSGNIGEAFEMALNIGFDESEIARFSLDLKQEVITTIETAYAQFTPGPELAPSKLDIQQQLEFAKGDNTITRLLDFIRMLEDTREKALSVGLDDDLLPVLAEQVANAHSPLSEKRGGLVPFLENMMYHLPEK